MNDDSLIYHIALTLLKGIGPVEGREILNTYETAEGLFKESHSVLEKLSKGGIDLAGQIKSGIVLRRAEKEFDFMQKNSIRCITITDKNYPYRLRECPDAPLLLYCKGQANLDAQHMLGMVGTRHSTDYGRTTGKKILEEMAAIVPDLNTVSGLAEGIDGVCHKTSIEVKIPTIAVMGRGLDAIYPVIHTNLAQQIVNNGGMLVSEYASGVTSMPTNFLARNRIIAGLSDATLVIESSARGGSLNTAAEALSYNRDVFALPGRANDEHSEGCNNLIKGGRALMITNAKDIVKEMGWKEKEKRQDKAVQTDLFPNISDEDKKIISLLHKSSSGMQTNEIAIALGVPVSKTSAQLMKMEFAGLVRCLPGNIYKLS